MRHRNRGGDVEGGGGDSQSTLHRLHQLPRLPPRVLLRLRYGDLQPQGKVALAGCGLEGGGAPCNPSGPEQGIQYLVQVQVTVNTGGIWRRAQGPPPPPHVLGEASDGGAGGRVLQRTLLRRERRHPGRPTVAHHLQCGGGRGGLPLGILSGGTGGGGGQQQ